MSYTGTWKNVTSANALAVSNGWVNFWKIYYNRGSGNDIQLFSLHVKLLYDIDEANHKFKLKATGLALDEDSGDDGMQGHTISCGISFGNPSDEGSVVHPRADIYISGGAPGSYQSSISLEGEYTCNSKGKYTIPLYWWGYDYNGVDVYRPNQYDWTNTYYSQRGSESSVNDRTTLSSGTLSVTLSGIDMTAPTCTATATANQNGSVSYTISSDSTIDRRQYKVDSANSWTTGSATGSISGLSRGSHTIYFRVRKTNNQIYSSTVSKSVNTSLPEITLTIGDVGTNSVAISASSSMSCSQWYYSTDGGSNYTLLSGKTGKTLSYTITGLNINTSYNIRVKGIASSNSLYGESSKSSIKTLGNAILNSVSDIYPDAAYSASTSKLVFNWTVYVNSYYHTIKVYAANGSTAIISKDIGQQSVASGADYIQALTSADWGALLSTIPYNAKYTSLTVRVFTYSDANRQTQVGNASESTVRVRTTKTNSGINITTPPTVIDINTDTTNLTNNSNVIVLNESTAQCQFSFNTRNSATVAQCTINGLDAALSTSQGVTTAVRQINNTTATSYIFYAKDSRGYDYSYTISPTTVNYIPLTAPVINLRRKQPVSSNEVEASFNGNYYSGSFGSSGQSNTLTVTYSYKKSSETTYSQPITVDSNDYIVGSGKYRSNNYVTLKQSGQPTQFDYTSAYDIIMRVEDKLHNYTSQVMSVPKATPVFDWGNDDFEFNVPVTVNSPSGSSNIPVIINSNSGTSLGVKEVRAGGSTVSFGVGSGNTNHGVYSNTLNKWMVYGDASNVYLNGDTVTAATTGQLTIASTEPAVLILKRNASDASGRLTAIEFQNNSGKIGELGMKRVSSELDYCLYRYNTTDTTAHLMFDDGNTADRVVEQATSGDWYYKKWSSGKIELWGAKTMSFAITETSLGTWYASADTEFALPSDLGINNIIHIQATLVGARSVCRTVSVTSATSSAVNIRIASPKSETANFRPSIYLVGTWS